MTEFVIFVVLKLKKKQRRNFMKASETNILKFIGGLDKVFIIPPFQRNYEWSFEQCDELFEDIINSYKSKKTHYLGNIVYYVLIILGDFYFPQGNFAFILAVYPPRLSVYKLSLCHAHVYRLSSQAYRRISYL